MCAAGVALAYEEAELAQAVSGEEVEYEIALPGEGAADRGLLLRPVSRLRGAERALHDVSTRPGNPPDGSSARIGTLLEALPYIREFHGRTIVIKYGGAAMEDETLREEFARDVVLLKYVGLNPIVVHGGGPEITGYMHRLGLPVRVRRRPAGLRREHRRGREDGAGRQGQQGDRPAPGPRTGSPRSASAATTGRCSGSPAAPVPGGEDIGFVGSIERVNADVIEHVATDYIPVIASVGADREGNSYNVNADEAAGAVAGAIGAYKLLFLTDVPGWLEDPADPTTLITNAGAERVERALADLDGGMRPKLEACLAAINSGVGAAHILDGRVAHSLLLELFTDAGVGTKVEAS